MVQPETVGEVRTKALRAKAAAKRLAVLSTEVKNLALTAMARALIDSTDELLAANAKDVEAAKARGISGALIDRLTLTPERIKGMAEGLNEVAALPDPVGESVGAWRRPNGLEIAKVRVPLGVVGIIYEARPNVTVDAAGLCLKAGNATVLRGGSEAIHSNVAISRVITAAGVAAGLPEGFVNLIEQTDRAAAQELMRQHDLIDVLIPRGGAGLIRSVIEHATIPVIETGTGNCHVYVAPSADLAMARSIVVNAKTQRPGVCNAVETLLVHEGVADAFLPEIATELSECGVELRGCELTRQILPEVKAATEADWETEFLDLILAIRVVKSLDEAIDHISRFGSGHSEAIVTADYFEARRFTQEIDAAAVYVNTSTRFTDGQQFGFGAEIGISTQKLHARGPMGLEALTAVKYVVYGEGQVRK